MTGFLNASSFGPRLVSSRLPGVRWSSSLISSIFDLDRGCTTTDGRRPRRTRHPTSSRDCLHTSSNIGTGTTYSCVATYEGSNVEIIANEQGSFTTPSFVSFTEEERLIGEAAKNQAAMNPANTVFDVKYVFAKRKEISMRLLVTNKTGV